MLADPRPGAGPSRSRLLVLSPEAGSRGHPISAHARERGRWAGGGVASRSPAGGQAVRRAGVLFVVGVLLVEVLVAGPCLARQTAMVVS